MFCNRSISMKMFYIFLCSFFLTSCSQDLISEFFKLSEAKIDNWSKENPLTIYAYPFRPEEELDPESTLGEIAWKGMKDGILLSDIATKGKIQYKGFASTAYHKVLKQGTIYGEFEKASGNKREILSKACVEKNTESLMYGLYDGDDMGIRLSIYMYVKKDNIIIKERDSVNTSLKVAIALRDNIDNGTPLSTNEKELQNSIYAKSTTMSARAIRKYVTGSE